MSTPKTFHRCVLCGERRSKEFHRRHPSGPGHPSVKGVCSRCRPSAQNTNDQAIHVHIHHHHWYAQKASEEKSPDERASAVAMPAPHIAELPANEITSKVNRRTEQPVMNMSSLSYSSQDSPPPVGPKPRLSAPHIASQKRANTS